MDDASGGGGFVWIADWSDALPAAMEFTSPIDFTESVVGIFCYSDDAVLSEIGFSGFVCYHQPPHFVR